MSSSRKETSHYRSSNQIESRQDAFLLIDSRFREFFLGLPEVEVDPLAISQAQVPMNVRG